jgi:hypothetical protein
MQLPFTLALVILAVVLFIAVRKKWISNDTLQLFANVAGVVALVAAIAVFVVPAAYPSDPATQEVPEVAIVEPTAIPTSPAKSLKISFQPNPSTPILDED